MKKVLALLLVVMLAATSAWAFDDAKHVKQAPNGKGDLLIFPVYFSANGGWQTKFTVTNTSPTYSVIAKVVFHSNAYSQELLDFLLYLTPNDVWTGYVTNDGTNVYFESSDDSMQTAGGQWVGINNPITKTKNTVVIANPLCTAEKQAGGTVYARDSRDFGYIEVVETWYGDLSSTTYTVPYLKTGENSIPPKVSKDYLKRIYDAHVGTPGNPGPAAALFGHPRTNANMGDRTINVLTGFFELQNVASNTLYTAAQPATVMADWDNTNILTTSDATGIFGNAARNLISELDMTLAKDNLSMPYVHNNSMMSVHIMSFPTKYSYGRAEKSDTQNMCRLHNNGTTAYWSSFWRDPSPIVLGDWLNPEYRCLTYDFTNYDTTEEFTSSSHSGPSGGNSLCSEVNLLLSTSGFSATQSASIFTEGWTRYNFTRQSAVRFPTPALTFYDTTVALSGLVSPGNAAFGTHSYYGAPVIPTVLFLQANASGSLALSFLKGAYSDGHVYGELIAAGTADPNATNPSAVTPPVYTRMPAQYTDTGVFANAAYGTWPKAPYMWGAAHNALDAARFPAIPTAGTPPYYSAGVPAACIVGTNNICTWLPEYQYYNEIIELGIESH